MASLPIHRGTWIASTLDSYRSKVKPFLRAIKNADAVEAIGV
ncbi:hypothetical protein C4K27_0252 [Pseudomonas chlororaphis subsp. chlororaphis]|nr:hypothetical protein C4K27_0252 [Pseudomonas chlororaphis subsp. chlororaphis]